jgi:hypothetical protein
VVPAEEVARPAALLDDAEAFNAEVPGRGL